MNKFFTILYAVLFVHGFSSAQSWQWAFSTGAIPRSQAVCIRPDGAGNFYWASIRDSVSTRISTSFEKVDAVQQPAWQKQINGNATITDIELTPSHNVV